MIHFLFTVYQTALPYRDFLLLTHNHTVNVNYYVINIIYGVIRAKLNKF
jgi:hypothetical protein